MLRVGAYKSWDMYNGPIDARDRTRQALPLISWVASDPFIKLPVELAGMVLDSLSSKDIANLRLATRTFQLLPVNLFRRLLFEEFPWLWEAQAMSVRETNWYVLYQDVKFCWGNFKGLKNRARIWKDVEEIVRRIGKYREEGRIQDE